MEEEVHMKRLKYVLFVVCWSIITSCSSGDNALIYTGVVEGTAIQIPSMTGASDHTIATD